MGDHRATPPVAVLDSGVGGLTVLHECLAALPHEDFLYLGDSARFPYGQRSGSELRSFALELAGLLAAEGAKLLVVACNSATAAALSAVREAFAGRIGVIGVVDPESRLAARVTRSGRIGLLATPATVASGAYRRAVAAAAPDARLYPVSCPDLAPLIQIGGDVDGRVIDSVERYCAPLRELGVDTAILGCTHYPLARAVIQRALGRGVEIVSSGRAVAVQVARALRAEGIENDRTRRGSSRFMCSGDPEDFRRLGARFLGTELEEVSHVGVRLPEPRAARAAA